MFIDEQLSGPYKKWVHTHDFLPIKEGVLIRDQIIYKIPMGLAGNFFGHPFIKKDLQKIFNYRKKIISEHFSH
jgi:ligand-binding SRPBCC domain-containing protein